MSYKERILDYLWSVAPGGATNGQIARALGISIFAISLQRPKTSCISTLHGRAILIAASVYDSIHRDGRAILGIR
jgi:hypothetical protein